MKLTREAVLENALKKIARWHGEFPSTGLTWADGSPRNYINAYGSNGERDYMRQVALDALAAKTDSVHLAAPAETSTDPRVLADTNKQVVSRMQDSDYQTMMALIGMPNSKSLLLALKQVANWTEQAVRAESGISSPSHRPNEQNAVQTEQPSLSDARILEIAASILPLEQSFEAGSKYEVHDETLVEFARALLAQRQDSDKDSDK